MRSPDVNRLGPRLTISFATEDYSRLQALAADANVSASWIVRRAVEQYLGERRGKPSPSRPVDVIPKHSTT